MSFGAKPRYRARPAPPSGDWDSFGFIFSSFDPTGEGGTPADAWINTADAWPTEYTNPAGDSADGGFDAPIPGVFGGNAGSAYDKRVTGFLAQGSGLSITWRCRVPAGEFYLSTSHASNAGNSGSLDVYIDDDPGGTPVYQIPSQPVSVLGGLVTTAADGLQYNSAQYAPAEATHRILLPTQASEFVLTLWWRTTTIYAHIRSLRLVRV